MSHPPVAVLLNPPSVDVAIRDNFCSKISQAAYINHPIDLLFQSGYLAESFQVELVDAVVDNLTTNACLEKILNLKPVLIYSLAGNATWVNDQVFFKTLRRHLPEVRLVCSGDVFLELPTEVLGNHPEIDAVLTDFTTDALYRYMRNQPAPYPGLVFRDSNGDIQDHRNPREIDTLFTVPVPKHEIFLGHDYRYPFVRSRRFATVMTEFGCPFHCSFCVMGTLGCKRRSVGKVIEELLHLESMGVRDVFFLDQSFGSDPKRNKQLCEAIQISLPRLRWICFSRVDLVDETILQQMKQAGCHTIIFGVETANQDLLDRYHKGYSISDIKRILRLAEKLRIRTVATFLLGLPGETWDSALKTIRFARSLPCTYASLNVAVPRPGTDMRKQAMKNGYFDPNVEQFDQSGTDVVMQTNTLTRDQLIELKQIAVRQIYLNPRQVFRMILSIRTFDEFIIQFREGMELFRRLLRNKQ